MAATTWADDVARERRAHQKSARGRELALPLKTSSPREYIVGKTAPLRVHPIGSSTGWDNLVLVVHYAANALAPWWRAALTATSDELARQAFSLLRSELIRLRQRNDFDAISSVLDSLARRGSTVHPVLLVAGLRLTYLYRSEVPHWTTARDEIATKLSSRGLDPSEILIGLFE